MIWVCTRPCTWGSTVSPWPRLGCPKGLGDSQTLQTRYPQLFPTSHRTQALTGLTFWRTLTDGKHRLVLTVHARTVAKVSLLVLFQLRCVKWKGPGVSVQSSSSRSSTHSRLPCLPLLTRSPFSQVGRLENTRAICFVSPENSSSMASFPSLKTIPSVGPPVRI